MSNPKETPETDLHWCAECPDPSPLKFLRVAEDGEYVYECPEHGAQLHWPNDVGALDCWCVK